MQFDLPPRRADRSSVIEDTSLLINMSGEQQDLAAKRILGVMEAKDARITQLSRALECLQLQVADSAHEVSQTAAEKEAVLVQFHYVLRDLEQREGTIEELRRQILMLEHGSGAAKKHDEEISEEREASKAELNAAKALAESIQLQLSEATSRVSELEKNNIRLEGKNKQLADEKGSIADELKQTKEKLNELTMLAENHTSSSQQMVQSLALKMKDKDALINSLQVRETSVREKCSDLEMEVTNLRSTLAEANHSRAGLEEELSHARAEVLQVGVERNAASDEVAQLRQELAAAKELTDHLDRELSKHEATGTEMRTQLEQLACERSVVFDDSSKLVAKCSEQTETLEKLTAMIGNLRAELASKEVEIRELQSSLAIAKSSLAATEESSQRLRKRISAEANMSCALNTEVEELEERIDSLHMELTRAKEAAVIAIAERDEAADVHSRELANVQADCASQLHTSTKLVEAQEQGIAALKKQLSAAIAEKEEIRVHFSQVIAERDSLVLQLDASNRDVSDCQQLLHEHQTEVEKLITERNALSSEVKETRETLHQKKELSDKLQRALAKAEKERDEHLERAQKAEVELSARKQQLKQTTKDIAKAREQSGEWESLRHSQAEMEAQLKIMHRKMLDAEATAKRSLKERGEELAPLKDKISRLEEENQKLDLEAGKLRTRREILLNEVDVLKKKLISEAARVDDTTMEWKKKFAQQAQCHKAEVDRVRNFHNETLKRVSEELFDVVRALFAQAHGMQAIFSDWVAGRTQDVLKIVEGAKEQWISIGREAGKNAAAAEHQRREQQMAAERARWEAEQRAAQMHEDAEVSHILSAIDQDDALRSECDAVTRQFLGHESLVHALSQMDTSNMISVSQLNDNYLRIGEAPLNAAAVEKVSRLVERGVAEVLLAGGTNVVRPEPQIDLDSVVVSCEEAESLRIRLFAALGSQTAASGRNEVETISDIIVEYICNLVRFPPKGLSLTQQPQKVILRSKSRSPSDKGRAF